MTEAVQPGFITVGLSTDPACTDVHTYDVTGKPAAQAFHMACFRDQ